MSTVSTQGYSIVGFKPSYKRLCKFCGQVEIVLKYEAIDEDREGNARFRWIARNVNTGEIHNCVTSVRDRTWL